MKNSILNFFAAMMLVVSGVAMADEVNCNPYMDQANDQGQTYNTQACACIWTNIYNGCVAARHTTQGCGKQTYNMMHGASDQSIQRVYCIHDSDPDGCTQSIDYYRGPAGQAPTPFPIPNPALTTYVSHNCPCLPGDTCNNG